MTQHLRFSFRASGCTAAFTASTRLSSSKYLLVPPPPPPPPPHVNVPCFPGAWMHIYEEFTFYSGSDSPESQAWATVWDSFQAEYARLSTAGGLDKVALKGLRRATYYEQLSFNPYSVMGLAKFVFVKSSTVQTYTNPHALSHFLASCLDLICQSPFKVQPMR